MAHTTQRRRFSPRSCALALLLASAAVPWTVRASGSPPPAVMPTPTPAPAAAASPREMFLQDVAWSPDGRSVAFSRYAGVGPYDPLNWAVWVADRDGANPRVVLRGALYGSFSPDGERLVAQQRIDGDWELVTARRDGSDLRRLTRRAGDDHVPAWSPDGKSVVYTADVDGNQDVWQLDAGGGIPRRLTSDPAADYNPVVSPDGRRIVFYREKGDDLDQVWTRDLATGEETRVTDGGGLNYYPCFLPDGRVAFSGARDGGERRLMVASADGRRFAPVGPPGINFARWSLDGKEVLFAGSYGDTHVFRMASDGNAVQPVLDAKALGDVTAGPPPGAGAQPPPLEQFLLDVACSPDGRQIAFTRYYAIGPYDDDHNSVWVANQDGSKARVVLRRAVGPMFSPDGQRIVASMRIDGDWEIVTVRSDGSDLRRLTDRRGEDEVPAWSADGKVIFYSAEVDGIRDLYQIDAEGGAPRRLTADAERDYNPRPSPDGKQLVFFREVGDHHDQVWTLDLASGRQTRVTDGSGHNIFPAFLPDGRIAYSGLPDGGERRWLAGPPRGPFAAIGPPGIWVARWPADGKTILFTLRGNGPQAAEDLRILRMNPDGSGVTPVLDAGALREPEIYSGYPTVSPDGKRIVFLSNRDGVDDLYLVGADGGGEERLTRTAEEEGHAAWSADGRQIRFAVFADDASRIDAIDADGKNERRLGSVPGRSATLSPDGTRVLYSRGSWTAVTLLSANLDGSQEKQLKEGAPVLWNVRWSPDGKQIAYTGQDAAGDNLAVWVMNADGSAPRQVTHIPREEGRAQVPAWSPDGRQLAIQTSSKEHVGHLWIVDLATGAARKLAPHERLYVDEVPAWFPDGQRLAFQSDRSGRMEVWVMNEDGSEARQLTR